MLCQCQNKCFELSFKNVKQMSWGAGFRFYLQHLSLNTHKSQLHSAINNLKMPFYAVARGRNKGIYHSWGDCEQQVKGYSGARYKKFDSAESAQQFINNESGGPAPAPKATNTYRPNYNNYNNNLKRSYATSNYNRTASTSNYSGYSNNKTTSRNYSSYNQNDYTSDDASDVSDDLGDQISRQLDDIEKRVNNFGKGIDRIVKKSTAGQSSGSGRSTILIEPPQAKKRRTNGGFDKDEQGYVQVYTDGACSANGRTGARAGLGVYWGDDHPLNTSEPVSGRATNNCGEIQAATRAMKQAIDSGVTKLSINTDSKFLIDSVTKWMPGWKRKGWKLQSGEPVKNETDFKELDALQRKLDIKWNYVEAHRGIHGNEKADQLAKAGAAKYNK